MKDFINKLWGLSLELAIKTIGIVEDFFCLVFPHIRNVHFIHIFLFSSYINLIYRLSIFEFMS